MLRAASSGLSRCSAVPANAEDINRRRELELVSSDVYTLFKHYWGCFMTTATLDIKNWGNSLGVRLPAAVARAAKLRADQSVLITVESGRVVIEPIIDARLTLAQRLASFDPQRHGGEALASPSLGAEKW